MRGIAYYSKYAFAQFAIQFLNLLSGFLLIRSLPKGDYAALTICMTAITTVSILADSGLGSALNSIGGQIVSDRAKFTSLVRWILAKRMVFMVIASVVTLPIAWHLLLRNGCTSLESTLLIAAIVATVYPMAEAVTFASALKLKGDVSSFSKIELAGTMVRISIVLGFYLLGLNLAIALGSVLIGQWLQVWVYRRTFPIQLPDVATIEDQWKSQTRTIVLNTLPLVIYTTTQGQLATYLLCFFATSTEVADIGALARFSIIYSLSSLPAYHFLIPSIARAETRERLKTIVVQTLLLMESIFIAIWLIASLLSPWCLWLLGEQYAYLAVEFSLYMFVGAIGSSGALVWGIAMARGWVRYGWMQIPIAVIAMACFAPFLKPSQVVPSMLFGLIPSAVSTAVGFVLVIYNLQSYKDKQAFQANAA